jgi:hypothetical protein
LVVSGTGNLGQVGEARASRTGHRCPKLSVSLALDPPCYAAPETLAASTLTPTPWVELSEILFR